jgi:hypothetical protein
MVSPSRREDLRVSRERVSSVLACDRWKPTVSSMSKKKEPKKLAYETQDQWDEMMARAKEEAETRAKDGQTKQEGHDDQNK